jgi:hypothetical protein
VSASARMSAAFSRITFLTIAFCIFVGLTLAQSVPYARSYDKPKDQVEQGLKDLQAYSGQKLPILDGFVTVGDKPLDRYERGFYQFSVTLVPGDSGATIVRLSAKITAWYADRDVAKSGYQVLPSNGRLELDLLDRLEDKLNGRAVAAPVTSANTVAAPKAKLDLSGVPGGSIGVAPPSASSKTPDEVAALRSQRMAQERRVQQLTAEMQSLKEIRSSQAHPQNLVLVRKSGTPIYAKGTDGARVLFQASANDEFEFLDADGEWLHIEISGDSRGWVRKSAVELPEQIAARLQSHAAAAGADEKLSAFRIEREETSTFPGGWASLRGKSVKIYTVQPVSQDPKEAGPAARLKYSLSLFEKAMKDAASVTPSPEGVVVIFDSADGGMVSATMGDIQRVTAGTLDRDAFWSQSYMDPEDAFKPAK